MRELADSCLDKRWRQQTDSELEIPGRGVVLAGPSLVEVRFVIIQVRQSKLR